MGKLGLTLESEKLNPNISHKNKTGNTADLDITTMHNDFTNYLTKIPIPIHPQQAVEKQIEKLKNQGHIEKATNIDETCFVSPAVITIKKYKSVKTAFFHEN